MNSADTDNAHHIREGFPGQRSAVLPRPVVAAWLDDDPILSLLPSDAGFYPQAQWHYVERPEGTPQLVLIHCLQGEGWLDASPRFFAPHGGRTRRLCSADLHGCAVGP